MKLSLSFIRGMVAAVNPCGFVLLPTYLFYFLGMTNRPGPAERERASIGRALTVSAAVSGGFMLVFVVIGLVTDRLTNWVLTNAKYATGGIGLVFVVLGIAMLFGFRLPISTPKFDAGGRDRTVRSMFVYGVAYAVASLGCTLPLFTTVLFGTTRRHGVAAGVGNVAAYGFGMALVVTLLTVTLALANASVLRFLRSALQYVEMLAGAFVLLSGAYLLWYFWWIDVRGESEPITDAVENFQGDATRFLEQHWQPIAWIGVAVVTAAVVAALWQQSRRRPSVGTPVE